MTNTIQSDAQNIRKLIREAEGLSDELLVACAKLKQAMLVARQNPSVQLSTGQKALMRLVEAESQAIGVSSNLFRVHGELNRVGRETAGFEDGHVTPLEGHLVADPAESVAA
ncbi:hypothetical protein [Pontixanthobacter aquaemixtae]|uniref:Uncharacterized protein n=1 Tax=Pontixanthobacter aquaemixtae TaxID=1958940 RepID=A0A844ZXB8_9SPHN|nr:hypothetical protein [Pontixanthobacter aquaemixtae]MXO91830.1 hypothetical protein [Pontixanthobacter aquaemixtae]